MSLIPKEVIASVEPGSIGSTELADGGVTSDKLADGSVTLAKIAALSITAAKLAEETITLEKLTTRLQLMTQATHAKAPCRVVATSNVTVAGGAPNTVDGVSLQMGDRVLCTAQSDPKQNGIRTVTVLGTGANGTWSWAEDANAAGDIRAGTTTIIGEGTHALERYVQTGAGILTPGTHDQTWDLLASQVVSGSGVALGTGFAPDALTTATLVSPSTEFAADQTWGTFTNTFDHGSIVSASGIEAAGGYLQTISGGAAMMGGLYSNTFPSGDFAMFAKFYVKADGTAGGGGIAFMQGTGATDDVYHVGGYCTGYSSSETRAWISYWTAYNAAGADIHYIFCGYPFYVAVRYEAAGHRIQTWVGSHPRCMALVDPNRTLVNAPTKIGLVTRRVSGSARVTRATVEWIRFRADTYDSAATAACPIDLAGKLLT